MVEAEEPEEVEESPAPPEAIPAPGVLHGENGLPADAGGGAGGGGGSDPNGADVSPCTIGRACGEPERVQEDDRQNNNPQP